jgi:cytochrome c oxidase assembly protein subunit 15
MTTRTPPFVFAAWAFVAYLLGVILFGAWVRITGSGAGCGDHWPTCHGEVIPPDPSTATLIEYTHRLTSGLCGVFVLALLVWAGLRYGWRHRVVKATLATTILIVFEALIGAGLVLKALVENDDSAARAIVIALHLANTLALVSAASLTAWWGAGHPTPRFQGPLRWPLAGGLALLVLTSMTGAVTALGDTLFPTTPALGPELLAKVTQELSPANHFLIRLRVVHPVIAMLTALALSWLALRVRAPDLPPPARRWAALTLAALSLQITAGLVNISLAAPGWAQLAHLLLAQLLWICALLMTLHSLCQESLTEPR